MVKQLCLVLTGGTCVRKWDSRWILEFLGSDTYFHHLYCNDVCILEITNLFIVYS